MSQTVQMAILLGIFVLGFGINVLLYRKRLGSRRGIVSSLWFCAGAMLLPGAYLVMDRVGANIAGVIMIAGVLAMWRGHRMEPGHPSRSRGAEIAPGGNAGPGLSP